MGICMAVPQDTKCVIEKFGKFSEIKEPGCVCIPLPCIWSASLISTRVKQLEVKVETKTKDNVFIYVVVCVQYAPMDNDDAIYSAFYKLANPGYQITSYVEDAVRAFVPHSLELDHVFESKQEIARNVMESLQTEMEAYGYVILAALVTDVQPDAKVKKSLNEINANRRLRVAMTEKAEAEKITAIKKAEAEAESTYLQGEGLARQRKAIADGMKHSVGNFTERVHGTSSKDVLDLMLMNQYFDTIREIGKGPGTRVIFAPKRNQNAEDGGALNDAIERAVSTGISPSLQRSTSPPTPPRRPRQDS